MKVDQKHIDRLLDLNHASRVDQIDRAFAAPNKALDIKVRNRARRAA